MEFRLQDHGSHSTNWHMLQTHVIQDGRKIFCRLQFAVRTYIFATSRRKSRADQCDRIHNRLSAIDVWLETPPASLRTTPLASCVCLYWRQGVLHRKKPTQPFRS